MQLLWIYCYTSFLSFAHGFSLVSVVSLPAGPRNKADQVQVWWPADQWDGYTCTGKLLSPIHHYILPKSVWNYLFQCGLCNVVVKWLWIILNHFYVFNDCFHPLIGTSFTLLLSAGDGRWRHHRCIPAADRRALLSPPHLIDGHPSNHALSHLHCPSPPHRSSQPIIIIIIIISSV